MRTIVLVEGVTDRLALTLAARRLGRDLDAEGVWVVAINGAHAIGRYLREHDRGVRLAGIYDDAEEHVIRTALERTGHGANLDRAALERIGFFACVADLEDELIRAAGPAHVAELIEREGDSQPWQTFRKQRVWQGRPAEQQLHRFIRSVSERNPRYVRAIVETIEPASLPRPLRLLLDYITIG